MKIGIDLNYVVRDINKQIIKYYKKDINKDFDESTIDIHDNDLIKKLPFPNRKARENFMYIDYPFEIFGCASTISRNLVNSITNWEINLSNVDENDEYQVVHFSSNEIALTIQSTYYFLSKVGSRVREVYFPKDSKKIWDICDVVITANPNIIKSKPNNKISVFIKYDTLNKIPDADLVYDNLEDLLNDNEFIKKINVPKHQGFVQKLKNKIRKIYKYGFK